MRMTENATLERNKVGLWGLVFYSLGTILPLGIFGLAAIAVITFSTHAVIDFVVGYLVTLLAISIVYQFSEKVTHAGGYYAFVGSGLGSKPGLVTGWIYMAYLVLTLSTGAASIGWLASIYMHYFYAYTVPVYVVILLDFSVCALTYLVTVRGVKSTVRTAVTVGIIEVIAVISVSLAVIVILGSRNTAAAISFPSVAGLHPFFLGFIVGSFESYAGYGGMLTLSEEAKTPKSTVRKALVLASTLAAVCFILGTYITLAGWGLKDISTLVNLTAPGFTVIGKYLGLVVATIILLLILVAQYISPMMAGSSGSRVIFALARDGGLPKALSKLNGKKAPSTAASFSSIIGAVIIVIATIPMIIAYGYSDGIYYAVLVLATMLTIASMVIHILSGISMPVFFKKLGQLSYMKQVVAPAATIVVFIVALYYSLLGIAFPYIVAPIAILIYALIAVFYISYKHRGKLELNFNRIE